MNLRKEGQRVSEKRGIVYHAGLYRNHGDSLGARNGNSAVNSLLQHMATDRKPTTSKWSKEKGIAESAEARTIQEWSVAKSEYGSQKGDRDKEG